MTKPHFDSIYLEGPTVGYIDWVAGGNFDGYIMQKSFIFKEENNTVLVKRKVLEQSSYDGVANDSEIEGIFEYGDKDTLIVKYQKFKMRGKILGNNREYIAFSVTHPLVDKGWEEVYTLSKESG